MRERGSRPESKLLAVLLSISMIFSVCSVPASVLADDAAATGNAGMPVPLEAEDGGEANEPSGPAAGSLTMENHSISWIDGSSSTAINGDNLTITPNGNGGSSVTARVTYSCGGNEGVETGKAVIRLPRYIFTDRSGKPVGEVELSIPKAPATGGATSFNYTIDTKDDDNPSNDEIVISNYKDIPAGGFFMRSDIVWNFGAVDVANGFTNSNIKASFSTQGNGGGEAVEVESDALSVKVQTDVKVNSISKKAAEKKENWQSAWGPKPVDADDYYYVVWNLNLATSGSTTTSPFKVEFEDFPGAIDKEGNTSATDNNKGEVVAWANYSYYNSGKATAYGTGQSTDYKQGSLADMNSETVRTANTRSEVNSTLSTYICRDVVMRYPKNNIPEQGETPTVKNGFKATVTTPEGTVVQKAAIGEYKYQRVSFDVDYPGDVFSSYKRQRAGMSPANSKTYASFAGGLNMLKNGTAVEADWAIGVKNMSWTRTDKGTKNYDTVLRDGMMYVAGERLQHQDYELTKFYPALYDIYVPVSNEDTGTSLGISTDYTNDYKPITVEIKDAAGNWSSYGTLTRLSKDEYKWDGPGAKTEKYTTSTSANAKAAIALPEGTQDIRFTHTDSKYGVEYRMGLYYKLKPSEHLMKLIGESQTSFDLMNISESWGSQENAEGKKEIYTAGNRFNNTSTPGIIQDVEASDTAEFGGVDKVVHDYASHRFSMITPTGSFSKSMSKTNEPANERVRVSVNLTWDYYYNFSSLGVSINDAIDAEIIKEQRNADFYDLLPAGVTVDMASIKATTYSTKNVDGQTVPKCDYTVEMIDNWRDSGQTMMIVHVQAPEGYRNFANSPTWVDTGFRLNFTMYDSWDNIESNGTNLVNNAAYYSKDGSVVRGVSDTGVGSGNKDMFENLAGGGGDADLKDNVRYASANLNVNVPRAAQMGFSKRVKAAEDVGYSDKAAVPATGAYTYQMRYALQDNAKAKGIVLYDVLESAYNNNDHWQGSFTGIDVSQIKREFPNTDVRVYYSTSKHIANLQAASGTDYTDLTDGNIWTTAAPADLSTVTAIAVDISRDKSGKEVVYTGPVALNATVSMQAPANYKDNIDDKATTAVDETKYAYNQAFLKQGGEKLEGSETTKVSMTKPNVEIRKSSDPATGTTGNPKGVIAGSTIDYTLDLTNKNKAETIEDLKVEDNIPEDLIIDEDALAYYFGSRKSETKTIDGTGRVTAEIKGQKISFRVDKLNALETVHLIIPVKVKETAAGGTKIVNVAELTEFNGEEWDEYKSNETHHKVLSTKLSLPLAKEITGQNRPAQNKKSFTFTLEGLDGAPMPAGTGNAARVTDASYGAFGAIEYTVPGDYKYTVKETKGSERGYSYDEKVHHITVHVENQNGSLKASWEDADGQAGDARIRFTNHYQPDATKVALPVKKILSGDPVPAEHTETFNFDIEAISADSPMPDSGKTRVSIDGLGQNTATKSSTFDEITFTEPGTYLYKVSELIGNIPGYTYAFDASTHTVRVVVTDNDGKLKANWTVDNGTGTETLFNNEYAPKADIVSFNLTKEITGNDRVEKYKKAFTFSLSEPEYEGSYDFEANNEPLPMPASRTTTIGDEGDGVLGQIAIKHAGTYTYTITELDGGEKGYSYDTSEWKAIVTARDVGGEIKSTVSYQKSPGADENTEAANFVNDYTPAQVEASFDIEKKVKGDVPVGTDKNFNFEIKAKDNAPLPQGGSTVSIRGEGTASSGTITYTEAGTYKYTVSEIKGSDKGYTYSEDLYEVTVKVTDNDGSLEKEISYLRNNNKADSISFENEYKPDPAFFYPAAGKTVSGKDRNDRFLKEFTFELEAVDNAPMPEGKGSTATVTDEGNTSFGKITFNKAGIYRYSITEKDTGERGYVYSDEEYTLEIKVTDKGGVLKADAVYKDSEDSVKNLATFDNIYNPGTVSNTVSVQKIVSGHDRPADNLKKFDFELTAQDNAPMPEGDGDKASVVDEGTATFGEINYDEAGTYKYTVSEIAGKETGYSYSENLYEVTVEITDNDGVLEKTVSYSLNGMETDEIEFTNNYRAKEASVILSVDKIIDGDRRGPKDKKNFEFELMSDADVPMPANGGELASVKDEGTADFGEIKFDKAGSYSYTVVEKNTGEKGYSYDSSEYEITIDVTDNDGFLEAEISCRKDGENVDRIAFTNSFKAEKTGTAARTADRNNPAICFGAMLLSALGVLIIARRQRRRGARQ